MKNTSATGQIGEDLAWDYLIEKGYSVIERNFRQKWGELDIIAKAPDETLVFVEVKTMRSRFSTQSESKILDSANPNRDNPATCGEPSRTIAELLPEDNLTKSKLIKVKRTAEMFAGKHSELINEDKGLRIDLIAITMFAGKHPQINHYENIF